MATQEQTVTQRLAPFQEDFLKDIFAQATALKGGMGTQTRRWLVYLRSSNKLSNWHSRV